MICPYEYRFAIDCDGVLFNFADPFQEIANKVFPNRLPEGYKPSTYDYTDKFTKDEWHQIWVEVNNTRDFYFYLPPMQENVDALRDFMSRHRSEVYFITSRKPTAGGSIMRQTEMCLDKHGLKPYHGSSCIIPVPHADAKKDILSALKIPHMLDDYDVTVRNLQALETTKTFLLDAPSNRHATDLPRLYSVADYLKELTKNRV